MWRIRSFAVAALGVAACAAPVTGAHGSEEGDRLRPAVVPATNVAGNSAGALLGDWYVHGLSLPVGESPFLPGGPSECLNLGRGGRVLVPASGVAEMACTVRLGRPVALVLGSADCSSAEPPPFHAVTRLGQALCAIKSVHDFGIRSLTVAVDGGPAVDIHNARFAALSSQRRVVFPENPIFGAAPGPATFVAFGFLAEIRGMGRGTHLVETRLDIGLASGPIPFDVTFTVVA
jgi:hypothetical protein